MHVLVVADLHAPLPTSLSAIFLVGASRLCAPCHAWNHPGRGRTPVRPYGEKIPLKGPNLLHAIGVAKQILREGREKS
jgi:hypothetical protein